jgi:FAD/FMN-containing dehydrogenase
VSAILKYCNEKKLAVVPQGGNTGLVGGSNPVYDEIILSTSRMNKILGFDENYGIISAESGCILQTMQDYTKERGMAMPIDIGARGSC